MVQEIQGKTFNNLTFLKKTENKNKFGNYIWECLCKCGKNILIPRSYVTSGSVKSCGCLQSENLRKTKFVDLTNKKFGKIKVISFNGYEKYVDRYKPTWNCECECGKKYISTASSIKKSNSCGCLLKSGNIIRFRKEKGKSGFNLVKSQYQYGAEHRNLEFKLNDKELHILFKGNCHWCDIEPRQESVPNGAKNKESRDHAKYIYNGIDRLDNKCGYLLKNSVSCCITCNRAKSNLTLKEFNNWIFRLCIKAIKNAIRSGNNSFLHAIPKFWK